MSSRLVIKDAARQLISRIISAGFGFVVTKIMATYLGPLRYGDWNSILKYFAFWTALADLGLYVLAVKRLGEIKEQEEPDDIKHEKMKSEYGKFVGTRIVIMWVIYLIAIAIAYCVPSYRANPYYIRWLPIWLLFSASFLLAWIQQLPLQIFWKMEKLSITLITARLSQILILVPVVYIFYKWASFAGQPTSLSVLAFCLVLFSVLWSGIGQNVEIHMRSRKILPLKIIFDRTFIKETVSKNRNYGVSYYISSFHTLLPLLLLTWFYPTITGKNYSWTRWLALWLIEILLIIPSALWNSLLHKIPKYKTKDKLKSMWSLMNLMIWIWGITAINFWIFADIIIKICSDKDYLWSFASISQRWANQVMPFLWIVLFASFIKQVYNYIFVATDEQNVLLKINGIWVIVGIVLWLITIPTWFGLGRGLLGATITQVIMELVFMWWAIVVWIRKNISPILDKKILIRSGFIMVGLAIVWVLITSNMNIWYISFFIVAAIINGLALLLSRSSLKKMWRGLTVDESGQEIHPEETYA